MKLNNKGYMLAEVVVSASLIAVVLVTLFIGLNRASSSYEKRNRYHDIDAMQVSMEINDMLKRLVPDVNSVIGPSGAISFLTLNNNYSGNLQEFEEILDYDFNYKHYSYIARNDESSILNIKSLNVNNGLFNGYIKTVTLDQYVDYLSTSIDFNENYDYIVVTELRNTEDINDCYYYALKVRGDS